MPSPAVGPASEGARASWSWRGLSRRHLLVLAAAAILTLTGILWWFEPQSLLLDVVVDESFPAAEAAVPGGEVVREPGNGVGSAEGGSTQSGPVALATGSFESRNRYTVSGRATSYAMEDGQRLLRLEDFESTNGPDLYVYLTVAGASDGDAALGADFVDLGVLRGNIGDQNYVIPTDVDLDRYDTVVIWCRRFTASFGVADLTP